MKRKTRSTRTRHNHGSSRRRVSASNKDTAYYRDCQTQGCQLQVKLVPVPDNPLYKYPSRKILSQDNVPMKYKCLIGHEGTWYWYKEDLDDEIMPRVVNLSQPLPESNIPAWISRQ